MRPQMARTNYFVTTVIGCGIFKRLFGDSMDVIPEVMGVAKVEELGLRQSYFHGRDECSHTRY
jgi:hypothetical protein